LLGETKPTMRHLENNAAKLFQIVGVFHIAEASKNVERKRVGVTPGHSTLQGKNNGVIHFLPY